MKIGVLFQEFQTYLNGKTEFNRDELEEVRWRRRAFLAFALVIFVIGIPVWWITTIPYRAPLPLIEQEFTDELEKRLQPFLGTSKDVWDNLNLHSNYNLHFIFIHTHPDSISDEMIANSHTIQAKIEAFSRRFLQPIGIEIKTSYEHFWDFTFDNILERFSPNEGISIDSDGQLPAALATELDKFSSPPVDGTNPLLKIAIFYSNDQVTANSIQILHNGKPTNGLAIASWGGIFVHQGNTTALLNAIMAVLQLQLSLPRPSGNQRLEKALEKHQLRLAIHNLLQTAHILNSLHELASKIEDLVISNEVADYAAQSKAEFLNAYQKLIQHGIIDSKSAAQAFRLAERANGHPSLLELLNFPSDQKYGIYVPLFLPLLVPLLQPLGLFMLFLMTKFKDARKKRREEAAKKIE